MNWERIEVNWKHFEGNAKRHWVKLSEEELEVIAGSPSALRKRSARCMAAGNRGEAARFVAGRTEGQQPFQVGVMTATTCRKR